MHWQSESVKCKLTSISQQEPGGSLDKKRSLLEQHLTTEAEV